jgi:hypothetical protein
VRIDVDRNLQETSEWEEKIRNGQIKGEGGSKRVTGGGRSMAGSVISEGSEKKSRGRKKKEADIEEEEFEEDQEIVVSRTNGNRNGNGNDFSHDVQQKPQSYTPRNSTVSSSSRPHKSIFQPVHNTKPSNSTIPAPVSIATPTSKVKSEVVKKDYVCGLCPDLAEEGLIEVKEPGESGGKRKMVHRLCVSDFSFLLK